MIEPGYLFIFRIYNLGSHIDWIKERSINSTHLHLVIDDGGLMLKLSRLDTKKQSKGSN